MVTTTLPRGFIVPSAAELAAMRKVVYDQHWFRCALIRLDEAIADTYVIVGMLEAVLWVDGTRPVPPGCHEPRPRTRSELEDLAYCAEVACHDPENAGEGEYFSRPIAEGALRAYWWALGQAGGRPLLPELPAEAVPMARWAYEMWQATKNN